MITVASATGVLRVMGDRHYATDALTGGLVGFAFGYGMPTLFHYGKVGSGSLFVSPVGTGFPFGPTISGTF
jgi:membrane-associated phospholipid phosphatase